MSNPQSKLDALLAEARTEARGFAVPSSEAANALARLRSRRKPSTARPWRRAGLVGAAATLLAVIPLLTLSQQSAAAKLLSALSRPISGVVRQRTYVQLNGQWTWSQDIVVDDTTSVIVNDAGGEEIFERTRTIQRDPRGFVTITDNETPNKSPSIPDLASLMKSDCFSRVSGKTQGEETLYEMAGSFRDGRNILVRIEASVKVDGLGRIATEEVKIEPNHHSLIEYTYDVDPKSLTFERNESEPIYDLTAQREAVLRAIEPQTPATTAVRPVKAFLDEDGYLAVFVEVPPASEAPRGEVRLDGKSVEAAYLNFNGYGARLGQEMEVPVRYRDRSYLLKSAKVAGAPKGPFRFEFPLWTKKSNFAARHPFAKRSQETAWTAETARITVPKLERTSSAVRLLCPRNIPFFLEEGGETSGAPALPAR